MTDRFVDTSPDLPGLPRLPRVSRGIARVQPPTGLGRGGLGLPVLTGTGDEPRAFPDPPSDFDGADFEWPIYWAATVLKGEPGNDWFWKIPVFGDVSILGFVPDAFFTEERVAIDVVDISAPDEQLAVTRATATIRRAIMARFQATYIVIDSASALETPVDMLSDALIGIDHSQFQG
jgi:hypothetical protein